MAGRVTQEVIETLIATNPTVRVTQEAVESVVSPSTAVARVTQEALESLVSPSTSVTRVTQVVIETLVPTTAAGTFGAINITGQSTVTVASLIGVRHFTPQIHGAATVSVQLHIIQRVIAAIEGFCTVTVHLSGTAAAVELHPVIAGSSSVSVFLSTLTEAQFAWTGESAVFIQAEALEIQEGKFNWTGESQLTIMPAFTPTGRSAEQAIHIAESDGGTWTATFEGDTTGPLAFDISPAALTTAMEGLPDLVPGDVVITGGPGGVKPFLVLFAGTRANQPVGLISVDGTNLTGPPGLHPRATAISLSPGYSADDDYGSVDDIQIRVQGFGVGDFWTFQGVLHDLKVAENEMGGDESATWEVEFTPPYHLPKLNSGVVISDLRGPWWSGILEQPKFTVEANLIKASFSARGRYTLANDTPWSFKRVFKATTVTSEIWKAARDELVGNLISHDDSQIVSGLSILEDVDLYNNNLAQVLDAYAALGPGSLVYGVRLPLGGSTSEYPILYVENVVPENSVSYVTHLRDGATVDLTYDSSEIVNRYIIPWAIPNDTAERTGQAVFDQTLGESPHRSRAQIVGQTFPSEGDALAYGEMLGDRHGKYQVHDASISIPGGVPVFSNNHVYPHWRIRPNNNFSIPDLPPPSEGLVGVILHAARFSWEQVTDNVSIGCGKLNDLKRVFRQLVNAPDQLESQPNEPVDRTIEQTPDRSAVPRPTEPWKGNSRTGLGNPNLPDPTSVPLEQVPMAVRTITLMFTIDQLDTEAVLEVDFDCIIRQVSAYAPLKQDGKASIIVGHSTYDSYGAITNLAKLDVAGNPGKARESKIAQQLLSGDVVYAALPTPMTGYKYITVALTCERSW